MDTHVLSVGLAIIGPLGLFTLLIMASTIAYHYRRSLAGSFRWHTRNLRIKQISAIASLFCLAMAGSYGVIQEAWALIYLLLAVKTATWWLRIAISQRT